MAWTSSPWTTTQRRQRAPSAASRRSRSVSAPSKVPPHPRRRPPPRPRPRLCLLTAPVRAFSHAARTGQPARLGTVTHLTADIRGAGAFSAAVSDALEALLVAARSEGRPDRWLLCGLHTCGDLACTTLRMFVHGYRREFRSPLPWCWGRGDAHVRAPPAYTGLRRRWSTLAAATSG